MPRPAHKRPSTTMRSCPFPLLRSTLLTLAAALLIAGARPASAEAEASPPPVADFFRNPEIFDEALSPTGDFLAILGQGSTGRSRLAIIDLATPDKIRNSISMEDADVGQFWWVNDNRLVFTVADWSGNRETGRGGLFAVDRDGSNLVPLIAPKFGFRQDVTGSLIHSRVLSGNSFTFHSILHDGSDDILVSEWIFPSGHGVLVANAVVLHRLNTRTRAITNLTVGQPPGVLEWHIDPDGHPRVATAFVNGRRIVYARNPPSERWEVLGDFDQLTSHEFSPRFIGFNDTLYAEKNQRGALYRYDLARRQFAAEPLIRIADYDFDATAEFDFKARKLLGFHYLADAQGTAWLDSRFAEYQKKIDAALPATINTISCGDCLSSRYLLIHANSDRRPTGYFLYDTRDGRMLGVGEQRSWIKPAQMGRRDFIHYKSSDGLAIPAYITLPPKPYKRPYPLVVLVHGGPWVRGSSWEWESEPQFLASRGYAVIQPEFRGSWGFGFDFFKAGWAQWGLAMQDDLAEAARWAVAQGIADPSRIAIAGASYGGYASLMGLIKNPEIFKCAVEWFGVTDINLLYSTQWSASSDAFIQYGAPVLIGDPVRDAERLQASSPLQNAGKITQPVLMAYGSKDLRVPSVHGERLRSAIATRKDNVEWILYPDEGHGWSIEKDRIDFYTRFEAFLDRYLRALPSNSGAPAAADATGNQPVAGSR